MALVQHISEKKYLSAREAAKLAGYTSDYVTRLAREEKVKAKHEKNQWWIEAESLKLFSLHAEAEKRARKDQLREERLRERAALLKNEADESITAGVAESRNTALAETGALVACVFLFANIFWFSFESDLNTNQLFSGIGHIGNQLSEAVVEPIPNFFSQVASFAFVENGESVDVERNAAATHADAENFQGVVIFEETVTDERIAEVRDSFSDEVEVRFEGDDIGVVTPVFKEREGDDYRFLLVPVNDANR